METWSEPPKKLRYPWFVAPAVLALLIALPVMCERANSWWHVVSFGGEVGFYRVDGGPPRGVGSMAGLIGTPNAVHVRVGDIIDLHLHGYGPIRSSNGRIVQTTFNLNVLASYQTFEAVAPGAAVLTTSTKGAWRCAEISPVPSDTPEEQRTGKRCPVLSVIVAD